MPTHLVRSLTLAAALLGPALASAQPTRDDLQRCFAKYEAKEKPDETQQVRRVRVDEVIPDREKMTLKIKGISLAYRPPGEKEDWLLDRYLEKALATLSKDAAKGETWHIKADQHDLREFKLTSQPHIVLQNHAADAKISGLYLKGCVFDSAGKLVLTGVATEEAKAKLAATAEKILLETPETKELLARGFSLGGIRKIDDWKVKPGALQAWCSSEGKMDARLPCCRVEKACVQYRTEEGKAPSPRFRLEVTFLAGHADSKAKATEPEKLHDRVWSGKVEELWKSMGLDPLDIYETQINPVTFQIAKVQTAVAADKELDGVQVGGTAGFDAAGALILTGLCDREVDRAGQAAHLTKLISGVAGNESLVLGGVAKESLKGVNIRAVLWKLRDWAAGQDDISIDRLSFDEKGQLKLRAQFFADKEGKVKQSLLEQYTKLLAQEGLADGPLPAAEKKPAEKSETAPEPEPTDTKKEQPMGSPPEPLLQPQTASLARELRTLVAAESQGKWQGVLIERGYFEPKSSIYVLKGLVDSAEQKTALESLVKEMLTRPGLSWHSEAGAPRILLDVQPTADLVNRLRRVMPLYAIFDGITLEGLSHDDQAGLIVSISGVGTPEDITLDDQSRDGKWVKAVRSQVAQLLRSHPEYRRRLPRAAQEKGYEGVHLRYAGIDGKPASVDYELAGGAVTQAITKLHANNAAGAKALLRAALRHTPHDSAMWYLLAAAASQDGDMVLARVALYRTMLLESGQEPGQRELRMRKIEKFQGNCRTFLNAMLDEIRIEHGGGKPMLTLADTE